MEGQDEGADKNVVTALTAPLLLKYGYLRRSEARANELVHVVGVSVSREIQKVPATVRWRADTCGHHRRCHGLFGKFWRR